MLKIMSVLFVCYRKRDIGVILICRFRYDRTKAIRQCFPCQNTISNDTNIMTLEMWKKIEIKNRNWKGFEFEPVGKHTMADRSRGDASDAIQMNLFETVCSAIVWSSTSWRRSHPPSKPPSFPCLPLEYENILYILCRWVGGCKKKNKTPQQISKIFL